MRRLAAVLGGDVSRSLSPILHGAACATLGLDVAYVPVGAPTERDFERAVDALVTLGAIGANVTVPYKRAALARSGPVSETAAEIGAVNTLIFRDSDIAGDNTDGPGLRAALSALPPSAFERVQILGAGGAARAAVWALARIGAAEVVVTARRGAEAALEAAGTGGGAFRASGLSSVPGATLVVSALPNDPRLAEHALEAWIDASSTPEIYDLAYGAVLRPDAAGRRRLHPTPSPLVSRARARGLPARDGLDMLVAQAALSLSRWTGANVEAARAAMGAALDVR